MSTRKLLLVVLGVTCVVIVSFFFFVLVRGAVGSNIFGFDVSVPGGKTGIHRLVVVSDPWKNWRVTNIRSSRNVVDETEGTYFDRYFVWGEIVDSQQDSLVLKMRSGKELTMVVDGNTPVHRYDSVDSKLSEPSPFSSMDSSLFRLGEIIYVEWNGWIRKDASYDEILLPDGSLTEFARRIIPNIIIVRSL